MPLLYITLIFLTLFNPLFSKILKNVWHVPNLTSFAKDMLLITFFIFFIAKRKLPNRIVLLSMVSFGIFSCMYLSTAILQCRFFYGLYFYRLYLLPIMFCWLSMVLLRSMNPYEIRKIVTNVLILNFLVNITAICMLIFGVFWLDAFLSLCGYEKIRWSMKISSGDFLRAGFPLSSPNMLGLFQAINIIFLLYLRKCRYYEAKYNYRLNALLVFDFGILMMTFSRSSFISLVVSFICLVFLRPNRHIRPITRFTILFLVMATVSYFAADRMSGGLLQKWVYSNITMSESSLLAHKSSVVKAVQDIDEYYLYGYKKGTVGPKAIQFVDSRKGSENSFFILLFDMGIVQVVFWLLSYLLLIRWSHVNLYQFCLTLAFVVAIQFLPTIQEIEIVIYFICVCLLIPRTSAL